jgi:hypothetical protein
MKVYYQKTKEIQKARAIAWHAAKRAREKEEPKEIEEEEEYKMTEKERELYNLRWKLLFNRTPFECQEYMFLARDEYDGYTNK